MQKAIVQFWGRENYLIEIVPEGGVALIAESELLQKKNGGPEKT